MSNKGNRKISEVVRSYKPRTLLEKHFAVFIIYTTVEFAITESLLFMYGKTICNDYSYQRSKTTKYINALVAGAYTMNVVLHVSRINSGVIFSRHHNIKTTFLAVVFVSFFAAFSALTALFHPNGTCTDYFDIQINAETYPDFLATFPLLGFMAISIDSKKKFSFYDKLFIVSLFSTIFLMFLLVFPIFKSMFWSSSLLILVCIFFFGIFLYAADKIVWETYSVLSENPCLPANSFRFTLASRKILLVRFLTVLFPVFPLIYALRIFKLIDIGMLDTYFMIANAFSKLLFTSLCTDANLEITHPSAYAEDIKEKTKTDRQIFLRYIFHEIRAPLNSMTLGINYLYNFISNSGATQDKLLEISNMLGRESTNQNSKSITAESTTEPEIPNLNDTLTMMNEATNYMDNVLNDVLAIHKIEEGSLKVTRIPFSMNSLIETVSESQRQALNAKNIGLEIKTDTTVPFYVKGDKFQLIHILSKVLSNAIKYSPKDGKVLLTLSSPLDLYYSKIEEYDPENETITEIKNVPMRDYMIDIIDSGMGMPKEVIDSIFSPPYDKTHPHGHNVSSDKQSSGLGLTVCKKVIEMLGGILNCRSKVGRGTTFTITIPLEVLPYNQDNNNNKSISAKESWKPFGQTTEFPPHSPHSSHASGLPVYMSNANIMSNISSNQQKPPRFPNNNKYNENSSQMSFSLVSESPLNGTRYSSSSSQAPSVQSSSQYQMQPPQYQMQPPQYQMQPPQYQMQPPQYQMQPPQYQMQPPQHQIQPPQHQMQPPQHQMQPPQYQMQPPQYQMQPPQYQMQPPQYQMQPPQQHHILGENKIPYNTTTFSSSSAAASSHLSMTQPQLLVPTVNTTSINTNTNTNTSSSNTSETTEKDNHQVQVQVQVRGRKKTKEKTEKLNNESETTATTVQETTKPKRRRSIKPTIKQTEVDTSTSISTIEQKTIENNNSSVMINTNPTPSFPSSSSSSSTAVTVTVAPTLPNEHTSIAFACIDDVNSYAAYSNSTKSLMKKAEAPIGFHNFVNPPPVKKTDIIETVSKCSGSLLGSSKGKVHPLRVMVVDDVISNRKLLAMLLTKRGFLVDSAEDGIQCVNHIDKNGSDNYDLIFLDNTMPNMTGIECVKIIRQKQCRTVVIGLTGNTLDEELIAFEEAGCDLAISKPLKSLDLEELLIFLNQTGGFQSQFYKQNKIIMSTKKNVGTHLFEWKSVASPIIESSSSATNSLRKSSTSSAGNFMNDTVSMFSKSWFTSSSDTKDKKTK